MPGEDPNPNMTAAQTIAYIYNITGERNQFLDQFPVVGTDDKVQKFCDTSDHSNLSVRFDNTLFGE